MRLIHVFVDNARYHHARLVREWLAQPGRRIKLHFHPAPGSGPGQALLSAPPIGPGAGSEPHRTPVGAHAQKRHPQPVLRHFRWFLRRHARLFEGKCSQKPGHLMRQRFRQFPRHIAQGFSGSDVSGVYPNRNKSDSRLAKEMSDASSLAIANRF